MSYKVQFAQEKRSFGRDAHGAVRGEGDTRLPSQISRINPEDQCGDRCHSQITLTCPFPLYKLIISGDKKLTQAMKQKLGTREQGKTCAQRHILELELSYEVNKKQLN